MRGVKHYTVVALGLAILYSGCATYEPQPQNLRRARVRASAYVGAAAPIAGSSDQPSARNQKYQPYDEQEAYVIRQADFAFFPDDFRAAPLFDPNRLVAWTGLVLEVAFEPIDSSNEMQVRMLLDHRYYDYTMFRDERPFGLSQYGEGPIMIDWITLDTQANRVGIDEWIGHMLMIYGNPRRVVGNGVVEMVLQYSRWAAPQYYSTSADYGRDAVIKPEHLAGDNADNDRDT